MGGNSKKPRRRTRSRPPSPVRTLLPYLTRSQPRRSASLPPGSMAACAPAAAATTPPAATSRTSTSPLAAIPGASLDSGMPSSAPAAPRQSLPPVRPSPPSAAVDGAPQDGGGEVRTSGHLQPAISLQLESRQASEGGPKVRGAYSTPAPADGAPGPGGLPGGGQHNPQPLPQPVGPPSMGITGGPSPPAARVLDLAPDEWPAVPAGLSPPALAPCITSQASPSPAGLDPAVSPSWASGSPWDSPLHLPQDTVQPLYSSPGIPPPLAPSSGPPHPSSPGLPPSLEGTPAVFHAPSPTPAVLSLPHTHWGTLMYPGHSQLSPADRPVTLADLRTLVASLPTKNDLSSLAKQIVAECKEEFVQLRQDVSALTARVVGVEETQASSSSAVQALQAVVKQHSDQLFTLQQHLDDVENRNRRNNIRLRGLPEAVGPEELYPALLSIFNDLLERAPDVHIELDRAHRALRPPSQDDQHPRDVICRVHYYALKEDILRAARARRRIYYKDIQVQLFPDLSRHTLAQRATLKPVLEALRERDIPYRWGFPFALTVRRNGKTFTLRSPADVPAFLKDLDLPAIPISDWPQISSGAPKRSVPRSPQQPFKMSRPDLPPRPGRRQRLVTRWDTSSPSPQIVQSPHT
ncbi:uncharacterized protein LOC130284929 [Hyla sarda]|uniref:uncharacterized protein LOC130284929 n=1 Tax=Hyla sarda TaxID=327740 RepID=UPI0024C348B4|nr:uncharacterized protein LOC130284929 [Hyla sarda]